MGHTHRRGFTLLELLIVLTIALLLAIAAVPLYGLWSHRQVSEGARLLQAGLAGARDQAIRDNAPSGIRLLPDPTFNGLDAVTGKLDPTRPLAYNRWVPLSVPPQYSQGAVSRWSGMPLAVANLPYTGPGTPAIPKPLWANTTALVVTQDYLDTTTGLVNPPANWFWTIRVGERIQFNGAGRVYVIVGPEVQSNSEHFVNVGAPGTASPLLDPQGNPIEFLLLVNGIDDNADGWIDSGWDGADNDGKNGVDDIGEWVEQEAW
jgi:prepilin-type N-terminal cleavage/methylation domain-containing protein